MTYVSIQWHSTWTNIIIFMLSMTHNQTDIIATSVYGEEKINIQYVNTHTHTFLYSLSFRQSVRSSITIRSPIRCPSRHRHSTLKSCKDFTNICRWKIALFLLEQHQTNNANQYRQTHTEPKNKQKLQKNRFFWAQKRQQQQRNERGGKQQWLLSVWMKKMPAISIETFQKCQNFFPLHFHFIFVEEYEIGYFTRGKPRPLIFINLNVHFLHMIFINIFSIS